MARDERTVEAIRSLIRPEPNDPSLGEASARTSITVSRGETGDIPNAVTEDTGGGGGIASPLAEQDDVREYHTTQRAIRSTDGLFTLVLSDISVMKFNDANGNEVQFNFDQPPL
ncbi:MAG: hypothetical protein ACR2QC_06940 [Gammaproteobacteria bacterium]